MSLQIVHYCDPILRRKGDKITMFDAFLRELSAEMIATMHEANGIGLAAQQIVRRDAVQVIELESK